MSCSRWVAICVDMLDHPIVGMDKPRHMAAWLWLLTNAAWKPNRRNIAGKTYTERRGELVASLRFIADATHLSVKEVRTFLDRLVRENMISLSNTGTGTGITSITICNYEKYQTPKDERGTAGAQQGHSRGTNLTKDTKVTSEVRGSSAATVEQEAPRAEPAKAAAAKIDPHDLYNQLTEAANGSLYPLSLNLQAVSEPIGWLREGADLQLDVLPAVKAIGHRSRPQSIRSWSYFGPAVSEAKARREKGLPPAPDLADAKPKKPRHMSRY
jgi:hypothetical protein